jgi:hypothetical protein
MAHLPGGNVKKSGWAITFRDLFNNARIFYSDDSGEFLSAGFFLFSTDRNALFSCTVYEAFPGIPVYFNRAHLRNAIVHWTIP